MPPDRGPGPGHGGVATRTFRTAGLAVSFVPESPGYMSWESTSSTAPPAWPAMSSPPVTLLTE